MVTVLLCFFNPSLLSPKPKSFWLQIKPIICIITMEKWLSCLQHSFPYLKFTSMPCVYSFLLFFFFFFPPNFLSFWFGEEQIPRSEQSSSKNMMPSTRCCFSLFSSVASSPESFVQFAFGSSQNGVWPFKNSFVLQTTTHSVIHDNPRILFCSSATGIILNSLIVLLISPFGEHYTVTFIGHDIFNCCFD